MRTTEELKVIQGVIRPVIKFLYYLKVRITFGLLTKIPTPTTQLCLLNMTSLADY